MTIGLVIVVALASGTASTLLGPRLPRLAGWVGLAGAVVTLALAFLAGQHETLRVDSVALVGSPTVRLVALGWASAALLLGIVGRVTGGTATTLGPSLVALGASLLALASDDHRLAFAALAVGGVAVVIAPTLGAWLADRDEAPLTGVAVRGAGASVVAGLAGVLVAAWGSSPLGPFGAGQISLVDPTFRLSMGLAILVMAAAVVLRSGAIPAHLWAARFAGGVTPLAIPASLAWGSAAFTLVALGWSGSAAAAGSVAMDDAGRALVVVVAVASIGLGGLAAILHDDLEHVLGYTIVQAAGVALLAFATLGPDTNQAATDWLVATAAVTSAMAAWIALARWSFGAHRLSELRGWARRSPGLAVAAAAVLVGFIGVPGTAIFDARASLAGSALPGLLGVLLVVVALSPIVALGRVLAVGVGQLGPEVAAAPRDRLGVLIRPAGGWSRGGLSRGGLTWTLRIVATTTRANAALVATLAAVLLAIVGLALAVTGAGSSGGAASAG